MNALQQSVNRFLREEDAVTAIEYGLLAGVVAMAIVGGAMAAGTAINQLYLVKIYNCITNRNAASC